MNHETPASIPLKKIKEPLRESKKTLQESVKQDISELDPIAQAESIEKAYKNDQLKANLLLEQIKSGSIGEQLDESFEKYEDYQEIITSFIRDFNEGRVDKLEATGNRNLGILEYKGKIIKLLQPRRVPKSEDLEILKECTRDMPHVFVPQHEFTLNEKIGGVVLEKAPGRDAESLTPEEINHIPDDHWSQFEKTIRELAQKGVWVDLTKKSNFFYNEATGFSFIDLEKDTTKDGKKEKFFFKEGKEFYYPFERYPFLPVHYTTSKALFTNIEKSSSSTFTPKDATKSV